jgi:hypothetical protein
MNPFLLPPSERLAEWRKFRKSLEGMTEIDQLLKVAQWGAMVPLVTYVLDYDDTSEWPTAWELINEGMFCRTAVAYMMEQTLIMLKWDPARLKLSFVRNSEEQDQMMVLRVDDTWVLNYSLGELFNFDNVVQDCALLVTYQAVDGGHKEL